MWDFNRVVSPSLSLFRGLVLLVFFCNTFNLLCSSARSHNRVCLFFSLVVSEYVCESVGRLFSSFPPPPRNVRFKSLARLVVITFLIYIFCSFALALGPCGECLLLCGFNFHWKRTLSIN